MSKNILRRTLAAFAMCFLSSAATMLLSIWLNAGDLFMALFILIGSVVFLAFYYNQSRKLCELILDSKEGYSPSLIAMIIICALAVAFAFVIHLIPALQIDEVKYAYYFCFNIFGFTTYILGIFGVKLPLSFSAIIQAAIFVVFAFIAPKYIYRQPKVVNHELEEIFEDR